MMCTGYISFYAARYLFSVVFGKKARSVLFMYQLHAFYSFAFQITGFCESVF